MGTLSGYYSTVQTVLSRMTASTLKEFASKTSDEDRMSYVLSVDFIASAFRVDVERQGQFITVTCLERALP